MPPPSALLALVFGSPYQVAPATLHISFLCTLFCVLDHGVVSNDGERIKNRPLRIRNLCRWSECQFYYESSQWSDIKLKTSLAVWLIHLMKLNTQKLTHKL